MPIRAGLIGHGLSGAYFHGPLLEAAAAFRIVAVAAFVLIVAARVSAVSTES